MTNDQWIQKAADQFKLAKIETARLDAEVLLGYMLGVDRAWLAAHGDESLFGTALKFKGSPRRGSLLEHGEQLVLKRLRRTPVAYLTGQKEFYGRDFIVTPDVLIPRPETEMLVELAKQHRLSGQLLDVGTGSGCLGLTLALETDAQVTLSDVSDAALEVARTNAKRLGVKKLNLVQSDLLGVFAIQSILKRFDVIVANLPYVDKTWDRSPETAHEPAQALFSGDGGLELIKQLIDQSPDALKPGGYLLLEADPMQHEDIATYARQFAIVARQDYGVLLRLNQE
ncbi:MAG TPA: peptide chain release factor N(5)-glutamine methyltransferase [Candidatus Saccharimonadales bacterium]|jgi:release factor glutamine methyltransferase